MEDKIRTGIISATVNAPTYTNITFQPSLINFFYGKNGTGKSTLAKSFKDGHAKLTWSGDPFTEDRILIYNEDFIDKNVQSYGNIPGVFTISESDATARKQLDDLTIEKRQVDEEIRSKKAVADKAKIDQGTAYTAYIGKVWDASESYRSKYPLALTFLRDKKKFTAKMEEYTPFTADTDELEELYKTAYGKDQPSYSPYALLSTIALPSSTLPGKPIISTSDTDFAKFIRSLGNLDWVTQGHKQYHEKAGGLCPYCKQTLPADYEKSLSDCYDEQYNKEKRELSDFIIAYRNAITSMQSSAERNTHNPYPTPLLDDYRIKFDLLMEKAKSNMALLDRKTASLA